MAGERDTEVDHHAESIQRKFLRLLAHLASVSPYLPCSTSSSMLRGPAHFLVSALARDPENAAATAGFVEVSVVNEKKNMNISKEDIFQVFLETSLLTRAAAYSAMTSLPASGLHLKIDILR